MKNYETMFILKATLTQEEIQEKIEFYKEAIIKNGGEIAGVVDMGIRVLAYQIDKQQRGYYFVIYFTAPSPLVIELERLYTINESILRFIILKYESKTEIKAWNSLVESNKKLKKSETAPAQ